MPYQSALSIVAPVRDGAADDLDRLLAEMGNGVANGEVIDFGALSGVHFARIVVVPADTDHRGRPLPATLVFLADLDVSPEEHLSELARSAGEGVDRVFGHCEGYPAGTPGEPERLGWLRSRVARAPAIYVNTRGRTKEQIVREAELREAVSDFLDRRPDLRERQPRAVRDAIRKFVGGEPRAQVGAASRRDRPGFAARIREWAHLAWVALLVLIALPFALLAAPVYAVLLRRHESGDPAPHDRAGRGDGARARGARGPPRAEPVHRGRPGQAGAVPEGDDQRGPLPPRTAVTRHVFNPGDLAGVRTIHFARWVVHRRPAPLIFASNYDGSLESYMDDFIDKVAWGLNAVFTNGIGYPRTRWLVATAARDELAFKDYLRATRCRRRSGTRPTAGSPRRTSSERAAPRRPARGPAARPRARRWLPAL